MYYENKLRKNKIHGKVSNQTHTHTDPLNVGGRFIYVPRQFYVVVLEKDREINWTNRLKK